MWVAGKTVWSAVHSRAVTEHREYRDEYHIYIQMVKITGRRGGASPHNLERGTLMQLVPHVLSCLKKSRLEFTKTRHFERKLFFFCEENLVPSSPDLSTARGVPPPHTLPSPPTKRYGSVPPTPRLHDTTGCPTGWTTALTTGCMV